MALTFEHDHVYVGGSWLRPAGGDRLTVISPATEQPVGSCTAAGRAEVDIAVHTARAAFDIGSWPRLTPAQRAEHLAPLAKLYEDRTLEYAALITAEMGSPARFTAQTDHPADIIDYFCADPSRLSALQPETRDRLVISHEPAGVVAVITPWNMPHKTILMKVIPALVAGCTVIVKPAPQTPLDALALAEAFDALNLPPGVLSVLPAPNPVAEYLATHPAIDKIAFTGSTRVGAHLAALAGASIRRVSLELGGKSPMLLLPDADVDAALASVPDASLANSGQICSNQTRILVHTDDYPNAVRQLTDLLTSLHIGDPTDPDTDIGPLVTLQQRDHALRHIADAHADGARITTGGTPLPRRGWYLAPTLFVDVPPTSRLFHTEVFAPVLALTPYTTEDEAIALANAGDYGLDAAVWGDPDHAHHVAAQLRAGTVRINGAATGIDAPLGGFKQSGIGRELGPEGLHAFTETKVTAT